MYETTRNVLREFPSHQKNVEMTSQSPRRGSSLSEEGGNARNGEAEGLRHQRSFLKNQTVVSDGQLGSLSPWKIREETEPAKMEKKRYNAYNQRLRRTAPTDRRKVVAAIPVVQ